MPSAGSRCSRVGLSLLLLVSSLSLIGCKHAFPVRAEVQGVGAVHATGHLRADADVDAGLHGTIDVRIPPVTDAGPIVPVPLHPAPGGPGGPRIAVVDVDNLLLNQNLTGIYSVGENPVASFREKLEAAAHDPLVRAVVIRINSPGGGVTATDMMAEELRRFRTATGKPTVACLMDLATAGAYYLAVGSDRVIAHPTTVTGALGALVNHFNLESSMGQFGVTADPIKAGELVDMGSVLVPLEDEPRRLLQEMVDSYRDRFKARVRQRRPAMSKSDFEAIDDGRVVMAPKALALHMIDRLGYLDDAIAEARRLAGVDGPEVVLLQRPGHPARSAYAIAPNTPLQDQFIPFSIPGLDRSRLPTFLYLWQADPTVLKLGGK